MTFISKLFNVIMINEYLYKHIEASIILKTNKFENYQSPKKYVKISQTI
jgi:hypothetical protein